MSNVDKHWRPGRVIGFGLLAEGATIVLIVLILTLHSRVFAAGQPQAVIDDFAQRMPAVVGPAAGILFTFIAAMRASRPLARHVRAHGLLVGVVTALLTIPGLFMATASLVPVYVGAILLKLVAGLGGGEISRRRRIRDAGSTSGV